VNNGRDGRGYMQLKTSLRNSDRKNVGDPALSIVQSVYACQILSMLSVCTGHCNCAEHTGSI